MRSWRIKNVKDRLSIIKRESGVERVQHKKLGVAWVDFRPL